MSLSNEWFEGYDDGFNAGMFIGELETESKTRVAAFGAIRRAATIARSYDEYAINERTRGRERIAAMEASAALGVRRAIRAAIGSPKA